MPWEPCYPYRYYEEAEFTIPPRRIRVHGWYEELDHLARRIAVLEQRVQVLVDINNDLTEKQIKQVESKEEAK